MTLDARINRTYTITMNQEKILEQTATAACACWNYYSENPLTVDFFKDILRDKLPEFKHSERHKSYSKEYREYVDSEKV